MAKYNETDLNNRVGHFTLFLLNYEIFSSHAQNIV